MKCDKCKKTAVINTAKPLCSAHFFKYFESKVADTIKKHGLLRKNEKIAVAASGGKDSTALMLFLKRLGYGFDAIAIDEGIEGYRAHTLADLKKFCKQNKISSIVLPNAGHMAHEENREEVIHLLNTIF